MSIECPQHIQIGINRYDRQEGGATIPIVIGSGYSYEGDVLLKLNAGFKTNYFKFQAFLLTPFESVFDYTVIGATVGFGF